MILFKASFPEAATSNFVGGDIQATAEEEADFLESLSDEDGDFYEEDEAAQEVPIRSMQEPLPTKPLDQAKLDDNELPELETLPEDDEPLAAKPLG